MFTFTRSQARQFNALLRRAKIDKPRAGVVPQLTLVALGDRYALRATSDSVAIELSVQAPCTQDLVSLPLSVLNSCEGRSSDPITIRRIPDDRISVEWTDQQIPQVKEYAALSNDNLIPFPDLPDCLSANPSGLWPAVREAVETSDDSATRYATDCIQLRGQTGQIAATDGQQALAQSGFTFPWDNDVLIPAVGVLGCRELSDDVPVSIGRTVDWMTFVIGDLRIALRIEKERLFPRMDSIFPSKASSQSRMIVADEDAAFLVAALKKLPTAHEVQRPVTVDLNGHVAIRGSAPDHSRITELWLSQSRLVGNPVTCNTNRRFLSRAMRMGFRDVYISDPENPAFCDDGQRQFVWALLSPKDAIQSQTGAIRIESPAAGHTSPSSEAKTISRQATQTPTNHLPRNRISMVSSRIERTESPPAENSRPDAKTLTTLIEDAEALRVTLRDVLAKTKTLVIGMKRQRRQSNLMHAALKSLRAVQEIQS